MDIPARKMLSSVIRRQRKPGDYRSTAVMALATSAANICMYFLIVDPLPFKKVGF